MVTLSVTNEFISDFTDCPFFGNILCFCKYVCNSYINYWDSFDCTLRNGKPRRKPKDEQIKFYNFCLDGETHNDSQGHRYLSYHDLLQEAGLLTLPDQENNNNDDDIPRLKAPLLALKIDVEGFEYDVFTQMIQSEHKALARSSSSSSSLLPQQIMVELHWGTRMTGIPWMPRVRTSGEIALFMTMMFQGGGYIPILQDFSPGCNTCMEVVFFKVQCPSGFDP